MVTLTSSVTRPIFWLILTPVGIQHGFEEDEKVEGFPHSPPPGLQSTS